MEGIGSGIGMDSSVIESSKYKGFFVVSTTDFFYPLVEDPYEQGKIACANVLSDMYAMGVEEVDNMLMILATSTDMSPSDGKIVTRLMIQGFDDQAKAAGTRVSGGQTVKNPWPIIGGVAKTICKEEDIILPVSAKAGDVIVLTKALGTQVAVNVKQWIGQGDASRWWATVKDVITEEAGNESYRKAMKSMSRLNRVGAKLMRKYEAHGATDVTGFGLLGHAQNLASNQKEEVSFVIHTLPIIKGMAEVDAKVNTMFKLMEGYSAETSGGLFVCMPADKAQGFCDEIEKLDGHAAWVIGDVIKGDRTASIAKDVKVIDT